MENAAPELIEEVAKRATMRGECIHNEPFPVTPATVAEPIHTASVAG